MRARRGRVPEESRPCRRPQGVHGEARTAICWGVGSTTATGKRENCMDAGSRELSGQVAIITGAGTNTGSTIARTLAGAGAAVVVNYRSSKEGANKTVSAIESGGG